MPIVGEVDRLVAARAGEVVGKALEPTDRVVAVARRRAAAGQARAAPGIVPGEADQRIAAILAHPDEPLQPVIFMRKEGPVRMGDPDPAALAIVEMADGAACATQPGSSVKEEVRARSLA